MHRISVGTDSTWVAPVGMITAHFSIGVLVPFKVLAPHYEEQVPVQWSKGRAEHKLTARTLHRGSVIAKDKHDCGPLIRHLVCTDLFNILIPFSIDPNASRKFQFSASTVRMEGAKTGVADATLAVPLLGCGEISPPGCAESGASTVFVGLTTPDYMLGWLDVAITLFADAMKLFKAVSSTSVPMGILWKLLGLSNAAKVVESILKGVIQIVFGGPGRVVVPVAKGPFGRVEITFSKPPKGSAPKITITYKTPTRGWDVDVDLGKPEIRVTPRPVAAPTAAGGAP